MTFMRQRLENYFIRVDGIHMDEDMAWWLRGTFGRHPAIQRCQIHKARNIMDRLPKWMHAQVRRVLQ